ncbi:MAG: hypothetical protein HKN10_16595 [Myxococcales bacterium]|nr:hypothetical protein [Myxococcales bacterium]
MRVLRSLGIRSWVASALLLAPLAAAPVFGEEDGCQGGDRVVPVTAFGRPQTTFSREPAATEADLQRLFVKYESDLRDVLTLAKWDGDPDKLFEAVRAGEATEVSLPAGTEFEWMAFRKRGKAACVKSIMWKGAAPFPAWQVEVESGAYVYTLTIPKTCLNLSMTSGPGSKRMVPPPTCELKATFDAATDVITVRGSTDGAEISVTSVTEPSMAGDVARLESAGENAWSYKPTADGQYSFVANARHGSGSQNTDCSAKVDVERTKPRLSAPMIGAPDADSGLITIDLSDSEGDVEITGITLPDGTPGDLSALTQIGPNKWTFDPGDTLPLKPGDYEYSFATITKLNGLEEASTFTASVTRDAVAASWVFRFFGASADAAGDSLMVGPTRQNPSDLLSPFVTTKRMIGDGTGFGLGIERLLGPRLGVELDALFLGLDGNRIVDIGDDWTMSSPGVDLDAISVGLNIHLTPEKKYDVFVGPFVSSVSYGDSGFNVTEPGFGSELGFGAKLGADWYFGWQSKWALGTAIRYLPITAGDDGNEFDVDPLVGTVGLGFRF